MEDPKMAVPQPEPQTSESKSQNPIGPSGPSSLVADLKAALTMKPDSYLRIAKNPKYFTIGLVLIALGQLAMVIQQYMAAKRLSQTFGEFGMSVDFGTGYFIKQGLFGFVVALVGAIVLYYIATKLFKAKQATDVKGFIAVSGFISAPMILGFLPIVNLLAAIWALVLFFAMMKHLMGLGFLKTSGAMIVSAILLLIVMAPIAWALGLSGGSGNFSFDYNYEF